MSPSSTADRPEPPRPLYETLPNACRAAIVAGNELRHIKPEAWAKTYDCDSDDVREVWHRIWAELPPPPNTIDETPEGK